MEYRYKTKVTGAAWSSWYGTKKGKLTLTSFAPTVLQVRNTKKGKRK